MRSRILLVLCFASLSAAAGELLPYAQANRAVAAMVTTPAVKVDQDVYVRFAQQARGLTADGRATLKAQFEAQRAAAIAAQNTARADYYTHLIGILQSIKGP